MWPALTVLFFIIGCSSDRNARISASEKPVALKEKIAVHIVYFTAWPKAGGGFDTWPDVYGLDAKQMRN